MKWTELYFESKYLFGVICCVLILVVSVICGIGYLCKKIVNKFYERLEKRTNEKVKNNKEE